MRDSARAGANAAISMDIDALLCGHPMSLLYTDGHMMTLLMVMIIMMFRSVMTTTMNMYADFDYNVKGDKECYDDF